MSSNYVLAIDFGGTFFKSSIIDESGNILTNSEKVVCSSNDKETIADYYISLIEETKTTVANENGNFIGIGVASPGPFDYKNHTSYMKHKLKGIYGVNLKALLEQRNALDGLTFYCMHDGLAFLLGEYLSGTAGASSNIACVTLGTGTGFSVMKNGILCEESNGCTAFSIYQNTLRDKKVEDYLSRQGIIDLYRRYSNTDSDFDVYDIEKRAVENNDESAYKTFEEIGQLVAEATKDILNKENIECLIMGGQISKGFPLMEKSIREGLRDLPCLKTIVKGKNIDCSAQMGVAYRTFKEAGGIV